MYTVRSVIETIENGETLERTWYPCAPHCDTALFRSLLDLSGDKREEVHAQFYPQANYCGDCWSMGAGGSGEFTAVNGYKFILNYQDCLRKFIILQPLKIKTAVEVADCLMGIFFEHGPPYLL